MFTQVLINDSLSEKEVKKINSLNKKFSKKRKGDLEKANELLFDMYCANNIKGVQDVLKVMVNIKFNGNFNLWAFVEPSYCLKYYLISDEDAKQEITDMLYKEVKSPLYNDDLQNRRLLGIQNGDLLESAEKGLLEDIGNLKDEYTSCLNVLRKLLNINALGSRGSIPPDVVLTKIRENTERLREIYKTLN